MGLFCFVGVLCVCVLPCMLPTNVVAAHVADAAIVNVVAVVFVLAVVTFECCCDVKP